MAQQQELIVVTKSVSKHKAFLILVSHTMVLLEKFFGPIQGNITKPEGIFAQKKAGFHPDRQ